MMGRIVLWKVQWNILGDLEGNMSERYKALCRGDMLYLEQNVFRIYGEKKK